MMLKKGNSKKDIFLLLGGNKLNYGIYKKFHDVGYKVYVIDWNKNPDIIGDKHYQIDVKDAEKILSTLKANKELQRVKFAYSSIDLAVPSVANINKAIGLKVASNEAIKNVTSKSMMVYQWNKHNLLNRISKTYRSFDEDIIELNDKMDLIIKPDNSASSRGITILLQKSNIKDIEKAFVKALSEASDKKVVVEEFVDGTEFTVEMLGDNYGNVSVYAISKKQHTKNIKNNKVAVKLHYNSIAQELQEKIAKYAIACYKSLGLKSSLGHLEIIMKKDGSFTPVEIGARSSGFIASDLVDIVSDSNFLFDTIEAQSGKCLENGLHKQGQFSSLYFFYDFPQGSKIVVEKSICDFLDKNIISKYFDRSKLKIGNVFSNITNDNERIGYEILKGPKKLMTESYIALKEKEFISIVTEE